LLFCQPKPGVEYLCLKQKKTKKKQNKKTKNKTDYAIDIFYSAKKHKKYTCFLQKGTKLPMIYLPDCLRGTIEFIDAPRERLKQCTYNIAALRF